MVYTITGVSPDIMDRIIHYIYTQDMQVTIAPLHTQSLLEMADYLKIQDLVCGCCDFLKAHLSPDNCLGIWQYADAHSHYELQDRAYTYMLHHFKEVIQSPSSEFLELSMAQLSGILENDELNIKQEKTAFKVIMKWIEHEPNVQMQHIMNLLPKVSSNTLSWRILTISSNCFGFEGN